jgi:WD40 repeat protein
VWRTSNKLVLLDTASGREIQTLNVGAVYGTAYSPGGETLLVSGEMGLRLWDVTSGRELNGLAGPGISNALFSPDGKTIAFTFGNFPGMSLAVWNIESGQAPRVLKEHLAIYPSIAFYGGGATLGIGAQRYVGTFAVLTSVSLWDVASGRELHVLKEPRDMTLAPDGKTALSWSADGDIRMLDVQSWEEVGVLRNGAAVNCVSFNSDGRRILAWNDEAVAIWDAGSRAKLHTLKGPMKSAVRFVFSPDDKAMAAVSFTDITLWDLDHNQISHSLQRRAAPFSLFTLTPDGKTVAAWGAREKVIKFWDIGSGKPPRTLVLDENDGSQGRARKPLPATFLPALFSPAPSPSRPRAATASPKRLIVAQPWLVFSPDARMLALWVPYVDKEVTLWDARSGKRLYSLGGHDAGIGPVIFSPDGKTIASGGGSVIRTWDASTGAARQTFKGYEGKPLVFSPDGRIIASWKNDHTLRMWDANTGWSLQTVEGHTGPIPDIADIAFAPDSKTIASASEDRTVKLWDVFTGQKVRTLAGHDGGVTSVAFAGDGKTVASKSWDGTTRLWDASTGLLLKTLRSDDPQTVSEVYRAVPNLYIKDRAEPASPRGTFQVKSGANGKINLFDLATGRLMVTLVALADDEWVVATPEGRFDTNKALDRIEGLHWIINEELLRPLPLDIFMRQYYEPELLRKVINGERLEPLPSIASINRVQPRIAIKAIRPDDGDPAGSVAVTVEVASVTEELSGGEAGGAGKRRLSSGVYDVRLFRDDQLVGHSTPDKRLQNTFRTYRNFAEEVTVWREANMVETVNDKKILTFKVKLPGNPNNRQVEFSAYAFNSDRVKSETARTLYTLPDTASAKPPSRTAYVITFGVNKFDNPEWNLQFAGNDARAVREVVSESLRKRKEFAEVVEIALVSDDEIVNNQPLEKRDATKENVQTVFQLLAGQTPPADRMKALEDSVGRETLRRIRRAAPDDLVLISFSSHGYANASGTFYIVPSNIGKDSGKKITPRLLSRLISSNELSLWMRDVDAGEMVMIVDACHSASAVEGGDFKPGPMGSRGLGQLAFDKGMRILTATQSDNIALENKIIRQGLLTYALIQDGIKARQADYKPKDNVINIGEWLSYGVERVPKLYEEVRLGDVQSFGKGAGGQVKVVMISQDGNGADKNLEEVLTETRTQQPALFNFTRKRKEVVLAKLE